MKTGRIAPPDRDQLRVWLQRSHGAAEVACDGLSPVGGDPGDKDAQLPNSSNVRDILPNGARGLNNNIGALKRVVRGLVDVNNLAAHSPFLCPGIYR